MKRKTVAKLLTLLFLGLLLAALVFKQRSSRDGGTTASDSPEAPVWRMIDAARASDTEQYLNCYGGEMEQRLRKNLEDMGRSRFQEYLRSSLRTVKGIAVSTGPADSPLERQVVIEYVYEDRNEVQHVFLRQFGKAWKICRVESAEQRKTLVPYGTPVTD